MAHRLLFALFLLGCLWPQPAPAQLGGKSHLSASLVAETATVTAGQPFTVGLWFKLDPDWHTYWEFPGDSGMTPRVEWHLPAGFQAGPIQWPLPHSRVDFETFLTYVYEREVLLMVQITPPAELPAGDVTLAADLKWQVCKEICIPGSSHLELPLTAGGGLTPVQPELFARTRALLPQANPPFTTKWDTSNPQQLQLTLEKVAAGAKVQFFPLPPVGAKPGHPEAKPGGAEGSWQITIPVEKVAPNPGTWRGVVVTETGDEASRTGWLVPAAPAAPPVPAAATATLVPPAFTPAPATPKPAASPAPTPAATPAKVEPPAAVPVTSPFASAPLPESRTLLGVLSLAFLGGLILNFMPCVLPVIALKIFGFVRQAGQEPQRVFRLGLAFVAGVFVFFLGLATATVLLKSAGKGLNWGFQFQNPYILAGMIALIFVVGLNLLGVFEITLSGETTSTLSELSAKEGYGGAFLHGLFTTLLGTSCTAPLLAASLGYAATQPAAVVYLLFLTIAIGMSLPYFLLTARPAWMKLLPKPGVWMDRFKQCMGFVMLAVVVWLFGVFSGRGPGAVSALGWYLLVLGFACWLAGVIAHRGVALLLALLIAVGGYFGLLRGHLEARPAGAGQALAVPVGGIPWQPFSEAKLVASVQGGQPVFIDFTADWCVNCHFFEATVLETEPVRAALRDKKVVTLRADWTNDDPEITRWLQRFGRVGVPLYVLYRPGEAQPVVLDALTQQILLSKLAGIK